MIMLQFESSYVWRFSRLPEIANDVHSAKAIVDGSTIYSAVCMDTDFRIVM